MSPATQNLLMILGTACIAGLGYYLYVQNTGISLQNSDIDNQVAVETELFLTRLSTLESIAFDTSIFSDPRFTTLQDFSQPLTPVPTGRSNPFAESN